MNEERERSSADYETDAEKHLTAALDAMKIARSRKDRDDPRGRDLAVAITETETAYLWLTKRW